MCSLNQEELVTSQATINSVTKGNENKGKQAQHASHVPIKITGISYLI